MGPSVIPIELPIIVIVYFFVLVDRVLTIKIWTSNSINIFFSLKILLAILSIILYFLLIKIVVCSLKCVFKFMFSSIRHCVMFLLGSR